MPVPRRSGPHAKELQPRVSAQGARSPQSREAGRRGGVRSWGNSSVDLHLAEPRADRHWEEGRHYNDGEHGAKSGTPSNRRARDGARSDQAGQRAVEGGGAPKRRYAAISMMASEGKPVQVACRIVGVPESSYYAWKKRPPSARSVRHVWLTDLIAQVHTASRGTYGSRRVHAELTLGQNISVGREAVATLMRRAGIVGVVGSPK